MHACKACASVHVLRVCLFVWAVRTWHKGERSSTPHMLPGHEHLPRRAKGVGGMSGYAWLCLCVLASMPGLRGTTCTVLGCETGCALHRH